MKIVVCKDEDADLLLAKLGLKERELLDRFAAQDPQQRHVAAETSRSLMLVVIDWLLSQGFKTS